MSQDGYRIAFGVIVLNIVNVLWTTPKFTVYLFDEQIDAIKPFLTTYLRTCMLTIFVVAVCFSKQWAEYLCSKLSNCCTSRSSQTHIYSALQQNEDEHHSDVETSILSEPSWIPTNSQYSSENASEYSGDSEVEFDRNRYRKNKSKVRFSKLTEVRHLSDTKSKDALKARMSYQSSLRVEADALREASKLPPSDVIKLAAKFGAVWFASCWTQQVASAKLNDVVVKLIMSTSSLFVIPVTCILPSHSRADSFSLTKVAAVLVALTACTMSCATYLDMNHYATKLYALYAMLSAVLFAVDIAILRHNVKHEDCLDVAMFLAMIGLMNLVLCAPLIVILHLAGWEKFEVPNMTQVSYLFVSSIIGVCSAQLLWVWCVIVAVCCAICK